MNALGLLRQRFHSALISWLESQSQAEADAPAAPGPDSKRPGPGGKRGGLKKKPLDFTDILGQILPSKDAQFGDYQANCAMSLGKQMGMAPREVASELVQRLEIDDFCEPPTIAGPGFINFQLKNSWLVKQLEHAVPDMQQLGIRPTQNPRTYVVDFSSPNVAKPMHVGHIRSTVIGDSICRVLKFLGHQAISDNHLGDWGTQFGMIIYGYKHFVDEEALEIDTVAELSRLYRLVQGVIEYQDLSASKLPDLEKKISGLELEISQNQSAPQLEDPKLQKNAKKRLRQTASQLAELKKQRETWQQKISQIDNDPHQSALIAAHSDLRNAALAETAALHAGDPTNVALWNRFLPPCLAEIDKTYQRLGVTFDYTYGESFYHDQLPQVVDSLTNQGLVQESDGAKCVFLDGHQAPFIIQKQDGAYLYATTDLATIEYRMQRWSPDVMVYVVDHRQSLHFQQLFATAKLWNYPQVELEHVQFGTVLGEDGKPYKTRSGTTVGLRGLLDEAVDRAHAIVSTNDDARSEPLLSEEQRQQVAQRIGIGAIKYADLAHNRTSDYVFSYDKMLAMTGNTAAYMQYSYARVRSIFSRGDIDAESLRKTGATILLDSPAERSLAVSLIQFSESLQRLVEDFRPNHLTNYLFQLASRYSEFFEHCPVLKADTDQQKTSRLLLCDLTARTIQKGLNLMGIEVVERM